MFNVRMSDGTSFGPADLDQVVQWTREGRIPRDALLYPVEGGEPKSVFAEPRIAAILSAPPTAPSPVAVVAHKPASRLIPTGNPFSLWGYYIGVFSFLIPLMCPVSLALGALGVVRALRNPEAKGLLHGIVAILLSVAAPVFWYAVYQWLDTI